MYGLDRNYMLGSLFMMVLLALGLAGIARTATSWLEWFTLKNEGVTIRGEVIETERLFWTRTTQVTYEVEIDGQPVLQREQVSRRWFSAMEVGDRVRVWQNPAQTSIILLENNRFALVNFTITTVVWNVLTIGISLYYFRVVRTIRKKLKQLDELQASALSLSMPPLATPEDIPSTGNGHPSEEA